jgi:large subunit ribosomal protein L25
VRRKVELKCPGESIPNEIVIDLTGTDIGTSIKISYVKLPENVVPTITDRDFVIATVAAPTVMKEPEKPAEAAAEGSEGEAPAEGAEAAAKDGEAAKKDDKGKEGAADKKPDDKKPAEKK